ncbi:MAG: hypothetical protein FJ288_19370, partial [Planctomycetes bacterium]|nr:hypothetical protein [Planctomycetota bacterium]
MLPPLQFLVALEMLLLPAWAGAMLAGRAACHPFAPLRIRAATARERRRRAACATTLLPHGRGSDPKLIPAGLARAAAGVAVAAVALLAMAAFAEGPALAAAAAAQAVALAFLVLLAGIAVAAGRAAGPRAAQVLTALLGWLILAGIILAGPAADLLEGPAKDALVRFAVHANPLVAAERELGLDWLHQDLTYRWTPLGESYGYLLGGVAWWKTALAHLFVGSGLAVFGAAGGRRRGEA